MPVRAGYCRGSVADGTARAGHSGRHAVAATRASDHLELGVSPRGTLALYRSAQALALIEARDYCIADDIKRLVIPCFAHRIIINSRSAGLKNKSREAEQVLNEILQKIAVPI